MFKRGPRQTVFVCAGIIEGKLITETIVSLTSEEAAQKFKEKFVTDSLNVLGPFFKKRIKVIDETKDIQFTNEIKKAIYNEWLVNVFILNSPDNQAYLVFIKRIDGKNVSPPKGNIIVPISDLRFI